MEQQWEYLSRRVRRGRAGDREITRLARDGWELMDRARQLNAYDRAQFRRRKAAVASAASEPASAAAPANPELEAKVRRAVVGALVAIVVAVLAAAYLF